MPRPIVVKTTINLPKETLDAAKAIAAERNASVSDVIKSALQFEAFVSRARKSGDKLLLQDKKKKVRELVILR